MKSLLYPSTSIANPDMLVFMLRSLLFCSSLLLIALAPAAAFAQNTAPEPLPFLGSHAIILFQGDSITDGGRWRTGMDYNHIMGQDYGYIIAAQIGYESPQRDLNFIDRGIGGDQVRDLAARWQTDTLDVHPQLLSILVGVNDTLEDGTKTETVEQYRQTYDALLAKTLAALPGVHIVLGEPFMMPVGKYKADYATWMAQLAKRQAVVAALAAKYHLPEIMYQDAFTAALQRAPADHWSWDGVHPTYAGHGMMVQEWLKTVAAAWPAADSPATLVPASSR
jgi:lysophospholipase L1-like esterase